MYELRQRLGVSQLNYDYFKRHKDHNKANSEKGFS